jgi:hypothetical protein
MPDRTVEPRTARSMSPADVLVESATSGLFRREELITLLVQLRDDIDAFLDDNGVGRHGPRRREPTGQG